MSSGTFGFCLSDGTDFRSLFTDIPVEFNANFVTSNNLYYWRFRDVEPDAWTRFLMTKGGTSVTFTIKIADLNPAVSVSDAVKPYVSLSAFRFYPYVTYVRPSGIIDYGYFRGTGSISTFFDGELVDNRSYVNTFLNDIQSSAEGFCEDEIRIVINFSEDVMCDYSRFPLVSSVRPYLAIVFSDLRLDGKDVYLDKLDVVISTLDEINGTTQRMSTTLTGIAGDVSVIKSDVSVIKDTVSGAVEDLGDSKGSIWSAGASAIGDKIEELFVPRPEDLQAQVDDLKAQAGERVEGLKEVKDAVTDIEDQLKGRLSNPQDVEGFYFPGITVPAAGMVESISLVEGQYVNVPEKIKAVLHPVAGTAVCIICALCVMETALDMFYCLVSGMSYAQFLRFKSDLARDD